MANPVIFVLLISGFLMKGRRHETREMVVVDPDSGVGDGG